MVTDSRPLWSALFFVVDYLTRFSSLIELTFCTVFGIICATLCQKSSCALSVFLSGPWMNEQQKFSRFALSVFSVPFCVTYTFGYCGSESYGSESLRSVITDHILKQQCFRLKHIDTSAMHYIAVKFDEHFAIKPPSWDQRCPASLKWCTIEP